MDLTPWYEGGTQDRAGVARQVDEALRSSGFLLITGHRVPAAVRAQTAPRPGAGWARRNSPANRSAIP